MHCPPISVCVYVRERERKRERYHLGEDKAVEQRERKIFAHSLIRDTIWVRIKRLKRERFVHSLLRSFERDHLGEDEAIKRERERGREIPFG